MPRREKVYRAYWRFAAERQHAFLRRQAGHAAPWTSDPIIKIYKFTNSYRASDRATQFLIRDVIYDQVDRRPIDELARIVLYRLFSKPSTWTNLENKVGTLTLPMIRSPRTLRALGELQRDSPIYTGAFILCANNAFHRARKFENHLALIDFMFRDGFGRRVGRARSLRELFEILITYPLIGPFMAYQLAVDINYSELVDFSENEFTVAGPGAERGIRKIWPDATKSEFSRRIREMVEQQHNAPARYGIQLPSLFGRPLHAIDCQNLFCELDKYARVAFPDLKSNRSRIKASFAPSDEPLPLFYPPKWGINEHVDTASSVAEADLQLLAA